MNTIVDGFANQVRATPDAVAVVSAGHRLTYRQLDAAVERLTGELRARGVGAGDLVAVFLPRSVAMLAAVLAVGRAGAAYLPLDPAYPARRREMVLADAAPKLVVTTTDRPAELAVPAVMVLDPAALDVSAPDAVPTAAAGRPAPVVPSGKDLAYVIFTSGSTGRPKGVAVPHAALTNFLVSMRDALGAGPGDAWLALASLAFDISTLELFLPLLVGGRTVIVPEQLVRDGAGLVRLIAAERVSHVQATPSGWRILLDGGLGSEPRDRVVALSGGEALPLPLARELRGRVGRLYNVYGPTETTVWSTMAELPDPVDRVTIGTPIANTRTYLLDDEMSPGETGELYIGGAGVADGYLGRRDLTAQRFVSYRGERVYRTGDLCQRLPGGALVYLGRIDNQVKLRGHRIELGDIEAALLQCPGVRQAAAALHGGRLVGYLVGEPPEEPALRERLAAVLPAVMVPTAWLTLDRLPLTPNGKLDRAALPAPPTAPTAQPDPEPDRTGTGDPVAEQIRSIWQETLQIDNVDLDDDLFDIGGDSLTVARIVARIHQQLGVTVPLEVCFDASTITGLTAAVNLLAGATAGHGREDGA